MRIIVRDDLICLWRLRERKEDKLDV
jgi:hypothetical protein